MSMVACTEKTTWSLSKRLGICFLALGFCLSPIHERRCSTSINQCTYIYWLIDILTSTDHCTDTATLDISVFSFNKKELIYLEIMI